MPLFLLEPAQTPYDLRWRMFGIPVRVHPLFWLITAILGWSWQRLGLEYVVFWVVCAFLSILLHELGHVWMGQLFGCHGHIVLYGMGGLAIGSKDFANRWKRIAVSFAGPLIQFIPLGLAWYVSLNFVTLFSGDFIRSNSGEKLWYILQMLILINLFWPLLNLLPIYPLDGGQIGRELFNWFMRGHGVRASLGLSIVVSGLLAINALAASSGRPLIPWLPGGGLYTVFLFGMLALQNYQELQQVKSFTRTWDYERRDSWERDPDHWKK
jgi:stage IV sporulation protein FB